MTDGAVFDVSLRLRRGAAETQLEFRAPNSVVHFVGPNGAGKTTALRMLLEDGPSVRGKFRVGGRTFRDDGARLNMPLRQRRIAWIPPGDGLSERRTILQNLEMVRTFRGGAPMDCGWALRELESHGLGSVGARIPAEVSLGQRRRIALIRALLSEPEVLLIDEPGSGLDVLAAFEFRRALASLVCRDMKLVLVTHDVRDLREIAGTVVVFQAGAVTHVGASADFIANPPDAFSAAFVRF